MDFDLLLRFLQDFFAGFLLHGSLPFFPFSGREGYRAVPWIQSLRRNYPALHLIAP